ncbi:MAG: hypothetical protein ACREJ3_12735 [Polyangiaceae bacterium]
MNRRPDAWSSTSAGHHAAASLPDLRSTVEAIGDFRGPGITRGAGRLGVNVATSRRLCSRGDRAQRDRASAEVRDRFQDEYPQHYAMTFLGFATGLRPSSLRPLRRRGTEADVLWDEAALFVRRSHWTRSRRSAALRSREGRDPAVASLRDRASILAPAITRRAIEGPRKWLIVSSKRPGARTLVRDGGSWGEQMEFNLDVAGYYTITSLPLGTKAAEEALTYAATRGAMKALSGKLGGVHAARLRTRVGDLDRTLVVVESEELLEGQKRGIAAALRKAKGELTKLERLVVGGRIRREALERRVAKALRREHLASFVTTTTAGSDDAPAFQWEVDAAKRRHLERTRLGKRVLCTDRHSWSTERLVTALRGQWNVEEIFRRSKKGGVVPWGPSHQWADASLRVHTFATVLGLMLVSLVRLALGTKKSARQMMRTLAEIEATQVRTTTGGMGRRPTWLLAPDITPWHARAIKTFELGRWMPELLSARPARRKRPANHAVP